MALPFPSPPINHSLQLEGKMSALFGEPCLLFSGKFACFSFPILSPAFAWDKLSQCSPSLRSRVFWELGSQACVTMPGPCVFSRPLWLCDSRNRPHTSGQRGRSSCICFVGKQLQSLFLTLKSELPPTGKGGVPKMLGQILIPSPGSKDTLVSVYTPTGSSENSRSLCKHNYKNCGRENSMVR